MNENNVWKWNTVDRKNIVAEVVKFVSGVGTFDIYDGDLPFFNFNTRVGLIKAIMSGDVQEINPERLRWLKINVCVNTNNVFTPEYCSVDDPSKYVDYYESGMMDGISVGDEVAYLGYVSPCQSGSIIHAFVSQDMEDRIQALCQIWTSAAESRMLKSQVEDAVFHPGKYSTVELTDILERYKIARELEEAA